MPTLRDIVFCRAYPACTMNIYTTSPGTSPTAGQAGSLLMDRVAAVAAPSDTVMMETLVPFDGERWRVGDVPLTASDVACGVTRQVMSRCSRCDAWHIDDGRGAPCHVCSPAAAAAWRYEAAVDRLRACAPGLDVDGDEIPVRASAHTILGWWATSRETLPALPDRALEILDEWGPTWLTPDDGPHGPVQVAMDFADALGHYCGGASVPWGDATTDEMMASQAAWSRLEDSIYEDTWGGIWSWAPGDDQRTDDELEHTTCTGHTTIWVTGGVFEMRVQGTSHPDSFGGWLRWDAVTGTAEALGEAGMEYTWGRLLEADRYSGGQISAALGRPIVDALRASASAVEAAREVDAECDRAAALGFDY